MKRLLSVLFLVLIAFHLPAEEYDAEARLLEYKESFSKGAEEYLPKAREIKFRSFDYTVTGTLQEKHFYSGSPLIVMRSGKELFSGSVVNHISDLEVSGMYRYDSSMDLYGTFSLTNEENTFQIRPNRSKNLCIDIMELSFCEGSDNGADVIVDYACGGLVTINLVSGEYSTLTAPVKLDKTIVPDLHALLLNVSKHASMKGKHKSFEGCVVPIEEEGRPVSFRCLEGKCIQANGDVVTISKSGQTLTMTKSMDGEVIEYSIPSDSIDEDKWWDEKHFMSIYERIRLEEQRASKETASNDSRRDNIPDNQAVAEKLKDNGTDESVFAKIGEMNENVLIGIIIVLVALWFGIKKLFDSRCPACGRFNAMEEIDVQDLGLDKITRKVENDGSVTTRHHHRRKHTYMCKYCGHIKSRVRTDNGD